MSPARRRQAVERAVTTLGVSERRACRALGQPRSSQRYVGSEREREESAMPRITPNLWFDTESKEAADFYISVFPNSEV